MLWVNDTQSPKVKHLKDGEMIVGTVVFMRENYYHATTVKLHLGFFKTEGNAMKAVEEKYKHIKSNAEKGR